MILPASSPLSYGGCRPIGYWMPTRTADSITRATLGMLYWAFGVKLEPLPNPADHVEPDWDPTLRQAIADYLNSGMQCDAEAGYAGCRLCDKWDNGSTTLTDGTYNWPQGFAHYVDVHHVRPPDEFITHVLQQLREVP